MSGTEDRPTTLRGWYEFSRGRNRPGRRRADFFAALPDLTDSAFLAMVNEDSLPKDGRMRQLGAMQGQRRKQVPPLDQLLGDLRSAERPSEKQLQDLFCYRGFLVHPHERILGREVPGSFESVSRAAVADFVAFDEWRRVPILVEVKCGYADDSLSGVVLELLVQWCFHRSAMAALRVQLSDHGVEMGPGLTQPDAVVAAPEAYFSETMRRSQHKRRRNEAEHALRFIKLVEDSTGMRVRFVAISDNWPQQGAGFLCREWWPGGC